jgi:hypothetical protein
MTEIAIAMAALLVAGQAIAQDITRTCLQDTRTNPLVGISRDEDDGYAVTGRV